MSDDRADLMNLNDPYRSMAYAARDLFEWLIDAGHYEQADTANELLKWIVRQGAPVS